MAVIADFMALFGADTFQKFLQVLDDHVRDFGEEVVPSAVKVTFTKKTGYLRGW